VWNVFYPIKANYLKTFSHALEPFFFTPDKESTIEMINNIRVRDAKELYVSKGVIDLDVDRQQSFVSLSGFKNP